MLSSIVDTPQIGLETVLECIFTLHSTMNDALENPTAFELCCIDWNIALDNTGEYSNPSTTGINVSPEHSIALMRPESRLQDSRLCSPLKSPPLPCLPILGPTMATEEDYVKTSAQYPSPERSSESVEQLRTSQSRSSNSREATVYNKDDSTDSDQHQRLVKHRAVNRRTAAKARQRDKVQTAALEKSFEDAAARNPALKRTIVSLHEELYNLQMEALQHVNCNCSEIQQYNRKRARKIFQCWDLNATE